MVILDNVFVAFRFYTFQFCNLIYGSSRGKTDSIGKNLYIETKVLNIETKKKVEIILILF